MAADSSGKMNLLLAKRRKIGYTTHILENRRYSETAPIFLSIGMHCLGCPSSRGETVEQACMVHGVQVDELLERINASMAEAK